MLNLPIFEKINDISECLQYNQITVLKLQTGSGKSTLIPPLLLALGFKRILVTQPRRLPCKMICRRVQKTFGKQISGWCVSGISENIQAPLIYATDGLANQIITEAQKNQKIPYDVIILDEVHERGRNIDLSIANLSYFLSQTQNKETKVILCSATVDEALLLSFPEKEFKTILYEDQNQKNKTNKLIKEVINTDKSYLDLANEISMKLEGNEQLLVFLPSVADLIEGVNIFQNKYKKKAYPIYANQQSRLQDQYLEIGQIFFSTTISETSLTFKNLKYVIDTGKLKLQDFDEKKDAYDLKEFLASKSSLIQRKGRLGRLGKEGVYYLCSNKDDHKLEYQQSELNRLDLTEIIFQLIKDCKGINQAKLLLQRIPGYKQLENLGKINMAFDRLIDLKLLKSLNQVSKKFYKIMSFPIIGHPKLMISLYYALKKYNCGLNIIILASIMFVMSNDWNSLLNVSKNINDGDIQAITDLVYEFYQEKAQNSDVQRLIQKYGISTQTTSLLSNCLDKIQKTVVSFINDNNFANECLIYSNNWENVARALLKGYHDYTFVNSGYLGKNPYFYQKILKQEDYDYDDQNYLQIDRNSKLNIKNNAENFVISLYVNYNSSSSSIGNISLVGKIDKNWLDFNLKRSLVLQKNLVDIFQLQLINNGIQPYSIRIQQYLNQNQGSIQYNAHTLSFNKNKAGLILSLQNELDLKLRHDFELNLNQILNIQIQNINLDQSQKDNIQENFQKLEQDKFNVFKSTFIYLEREHKIQIKVNKNILHINQALDQHCGYIAYIFQQFFKWFIRCKIIITEDIKVKPQPLNQQKLNQNIDLKQMNERIRNITDPERPQHELKFLANSSSSRIQRMELVCWILVNNYECIIKGGFIRDWIVGGNAYFPPGTQLVFNQQNGHLEIDENNNVTPKDIDVQLPSKPSNNKIFDPYEFMRIIRPYGIEVEQEGNDGWRYYFIFDRNRPSGAFTVDIIQSFCSICFDKMDMDVNNLFIMKGYTKDLGMNIPLDNLIPIQSNNSQKRQKLELEDIINNIHSKNYVQLANNVTYRNDKMTQRGWKKKNLHYEIVYPSISQRTIQIEIKQDAQDQDYKFVTNLMAPLKNIKIVKIYQLKNKNWDNIYEYLGEIIANNNNNNRNEKILFHGTSANGAEGITKNCFDSKYFNPNGAWGPGAYFADDPNKSDNYAQPDAQRQQNIFVCKVLLGKQQALTQAQNLRVPGIGYDSIFGTAFRFNEYIVYTFLQAKPLYRIIYTK